MRVAVFPRVDGNSVTTAVRYCHRPERTFESQCISQSCHFEGKRRTIYKTIPCGYRGPPRCFNRTSDDHKFLGSIVRTVAPRGERVYAHTNVSWIELVVRLLASGAKKPLTASMRIEMWWGG